MTLDWWHQVGRVLVGGLGAYLALVTVVRISGKRTLAKLNAFDLVVTVALGSVLASTVLGSGVGVAQGMAAFVVLAGAQLLVAWVSVRLGAVRRTVKSSPTLLVDDGRLVTSALRRQRVAAEEVRQAVRSSGAGDLSQVAAVVLETDGSFSVVTRDRLGDGSALVDVRGGPARSSGVDR